MALIRWTGASSIRRLTIVDLPEPLGPDKTTIRRSWSGWRPDWDRGTVALPWRTSLDVLQHLAHPFDRGLDFDDCVRHVNVVCLGTDRVDFADHLLGEEVELSPRGLGLAHERLELLQVRTQPHDLFTDVAALRVDADLTDQVGRFNRRFAVSQQLPHPIVQLIAKLANDLRRAGGNLVQLRGGSPQVRLQVLLQDRKG